MANKKITIEGLAIMIGKGFEGVDKKFEGVNERFDEIQAELKGIRKQLTGVVYRNEFEELETRVKELENLLALPSKVK